MNLNKHVSKLLFVALLFLISFASCEQKNNETITSPSDAPWPITSYNFGGLQELGPKAQIDLLHSTGYDGIILKSATKEDFQDLDEAIAAAESLSDFKIDAIFERYNFGDDPERRERWKEVVDKISGKDIQLWVIFGKKMEGITDTFIENKLREIVTYAAPKNVEVILYPHSSCYLESAEEALPFVDKINHPNLNLAFHLYHEVRAKNGHRIDEVIAKVSHRLGAVTLAGTDTIADYSSPLARDTSTIKPLGRGNYDLNNFIAILNEANYKGSVGFMNFAIKEDPGIYLPRSVKVWEVYNENGGE